MNLSPAYGRTASLSPSDPRFQGRRYRQLVAGFNVYRVSPIAAESVPPPRLFTAYRGVPLACSASVLSVGQDDVTFAVDRLHAKAIARTGNSVIMSPLHGMSFRATSTGVDAEQGRASFAHFITHRRSATEQRSNLRIEPEFSINVNLGCFDKERHGRLHDLSVVSLAVSMSEDEYDGMRDGDMVKVRIPKLAPGNTLSLDAKGRILRSTAVATAQGKARDVVISLQLEPQLHDCLERYVEIRRIAMIRELVSSDVSGRDDDATRPGLALR